MGSYDFNVITAGHLTSTMATGTIVIPIHDGRILSAGAYAAVIGSKLTAATDPSIDIVTNTHRIIWAATSVVAVSWQVVAPADFDAGHVVTVNAVLSMSNTNNTPVMTVGFSEGTASSVGGNTAAITGTTPAVMTRAIAVGDLVGGKQWNITLTPAAHANDTIRLDALYVTYTRK